MFLKPHPATTSARWSYNSKTLKGHKYNLKKTLGELFRSEHFYARSFAQPTSRAPIELVVGTEILRDLGVPVRTMLTNTNTRTAAARFTPMDTHPLSVKGWDGGRLGSTPAPCSSGRTPRCGC